MAADVHLGRQADDGDADVMRLECLDGGADVGRVARRQTAVQDEHLAARVCRHVLQRAQRQFQRVL